MALSIAAASYALQRYKKASFADPKGISHEIVTREQADVIFNEMDPSSSGDRTKVKG